MSAMEEAIKKAMELLGSSLKMEEEGEGESETQENEYGTTESMDTSPEHEAMENPSQEAAEHETGMEMGDEGQEERKSLLDSITGASSHKPLPKKGVGIMAIIEKKNNEKKSFRK